MKSNMKVLDHKNQEFMVVAEMFWHWFYLLKQGYIEILAKI